MSGELRSTTFVGTKTAKSVERHVRRRLGEGGRAEGMGFLNRRERAVYSQLADYCRQRSGNVTKVGGAEGAEGMGFLNRRERRERRWGEQREQRGWDF